MRFSPSSIALVVAASMRKLGFFMKKVKLKNLMAHKLCVLEFLFIYHINTAPSVIRSHKYTNCFPSFCSAKFCTLLESVAVLSGTVQCGPCKVARPVTVDCGTSLASRQCKSLLDAGPSDRPLGARWRWKVCATLMRF